jgi:hypothetical protein
MELAALEAAAQEVMQTLACQFCGKGMPYNTEFCALRLGEVRVQSFVPDVKEGDVLMHIECWDKVIAEHRENKRATILFPCLVCRDEVRGEAVQVIRFKIVKQTRTPPRQPLTSLVGVARPACDHLCVECASRVHRDSVELWDFFEGVYYE